VPWYDRGDAFWIQIVYQGTDCEHFILRRVSHHGAGNGYDETAYDEKAYDERAYDERAYDESAYDESVYKRAT
jgi:hypothetical protein